MIIKDASKLADLLLENWGLWCGGDDSKRLGYTILPTSRDYVAPYGEKRKSLPAINEIDALVANAAILHIRLKEFPRDVMPHGFYSTYAFIVEKWARPHPAPARQLAAHYGVHRNTIYNRSNRAKDEFLAEYLLIVRDAHKLNRRSK